LFRKAQPSMLRKPHWNLSRQQASTTSNLTVLSLQSSPKLHCDKTSRLRHIKRRIHFGTYPMRFGPSGGTGALTLHAQVESLSSDLSKHIHLDTATLSTACTRPPYVRITVRYPVLISPPLLRWQRSHLEWFETSQSTFLESDIAYA
jgi:hypothetical protein